MRRAHFIGLRGGAWLRRGQRGSFTNLGHGGTLGTVAPSFD